VAEDEVVAVVVAVVVGVVEVDSGSREAMADGREV
jgi:hypothetical protein